MELHANVICLFFVLAVEDEKVVAIGRDPEKKKLFLFSKIIFYVHYYFVFTNNILREAKTISNDPSHEKLQFLTFSINDTKINDYIY